MSKFFLIKFFRKRFVEFCLRAGGPQFAKRGLWFLQSSFFFVGQYFVEHYEICSFSNSRSLSRSQVIRHNWTERNCVAMK